MPPMRKQTNLRLQSFGRPITLLKGFLFFIFLLIQTYSFAQFNYGIRSGGQFTTISPDHQFENRKLSWHGGAFVSYDFTKKISASTDILFIKKGCKTSNYSNTANNRYILNYLTLPVVLNYRLWPRLSILTGGEVAVLLSSYYKSDLFKQNVKYIFGNPVDFGITGGLLYHISPKVNISLRYTYGLSNIMNKDFKGWDGFKAHNEGLQLSLGYAFRKNANLKSIDSVRLFRIPQGERRAIISLGMRQGASFYNFTITGEDAQTQKILMLKKESATRLGSISGSTFTNMCMLLSA